MTDAELVKRLESALYDNADRPRAGELVREDGWMQLTTPEARTPYRNGILRSVLSEAEVSIRIEEAIAHYGCRDLPFRWVVTPSSRPHALREMLLRAGLTPFEVLEGLVAEPAEFPKPSELAIDIVEVGPNLRETALACQAKAWGFPPEAVTRFRKEMALDAQFPERGAHHFLAYRDGAPAGAAALVVKGDCAHFSGSAVIPEQRRRGVYRELIYARMAFLRAAGCKLVTNHCVSTTSAPVCKKLGFRKVCEFQVLSWSPPESAA